MDEPSTRESIISSNETAFVRGCHEISFAQNDKQVNELPLIVAYSLPSGAIKTSRGFATGDGQMKARCDVCAERQWKWEAKNLAGRCIDTGGFHAIGSPFPVLLLSPLVLGSSAFRRDALLSRIGYRRRIRPQLERNRRLLWFV